MSEKILKGVLSLLLVVVLVGIVAYLQIAFQKADMKTAIRLVQEARIQGETLGIRIEKVMPLRERRCSVKIIDKFYGHMEVDCQNTVFPSQRLSWKVNVIDGMVGPLNQAAKILGEGESPW
ncbi:MAG: hypothetical protein KDD48_05165 [Bdellovibrionales bacterium]|nr:hypothetical protein [Bdellovibrionales bacterium]